MIENIEIIGNDFKVEEGFKKYVEKKLGKLDKYLPRKSKKNVIAKVVVAEVGKGKTEKYEISAAMEIPGGKVLNAREECANVFVGADLIEAKLTGQIRRYKLEMQPHRQKRSLKKLFIRRK